MVQFSVGLEGTILVKSFAGNGLDKDKDFLRCRRGNIGEFRVEVSDQLWLAVGGGKVGGVL